MTKKLDVISGRVPPHYVRNAPPNNVKIKDVAGKKTVVTIEMTPLTVSKRGGLSKETIEDVKRVFSDELNRAFQLYKYQSE